MLCWVVIDSDERLIRHTLHPQRKGAIFEFIKGFVRTVNDASAHCMSKEERALLWGHLENQYNLKVRLVELKFIGNTFQSQSSNSSLTPHSLTGGLSTVFK